MSHDLREVSVLRIATQAHRLARIGEMTGEAALALVVWPDPEDMFRFLEDPPEIPRLAERVSQGFSLVRLYHEELSPVPGMCKDYIYFGERYTERVRCSRRAVEGDYCKIHAGKFAEQKLAA